MATAIITPKRGGNSPVKGAKLMTKRFGESTVDNMEDGKVVGDYNSPEIPGTLRTKFVPYSLGKRKFLVLDEKGIELTSDELQKLVKECYLSIEDGPDAGKLITSADPYNRRDPFFNHSQLLFMMKEGNGKLEDDNPKDKLLLGALRAAPEFADAKENSKSGSVLFNISDKEFEKTKVTLDNNKERKSIRLLEAQTDSKKLAIAKIMALGVNDTTDRDTVDNVLYNALKGNRTNQDGRTSRDTFIQLCEMKSADFNLFVLISEAKRSGVIKPTKSGFTFRNSRIASTDMGLFDFFNKGDNGQMLSFLEEAMGKIGGIKGDKGDTTTE